MPKIVVIGGSAGSINVFKTVVKALPPDFPAAVLIVSHIGARDSILPALLQHVTALPVRHAVQGEPIVAGAVLVASPDVHLSVAMDSGRPFVQLTRGPKENHSRPAIDPLFRSAASAYKADAIAVLLSGAIWAINGSKPLRYRCHTGHAFTTRVLASLQAGEVEEALWPRYGHCTNRSNCSASYTRKRGIQKRRPASAWTGAPNTSSRPSRPRNTPRRCAT